MHISSKQTRGSFKSQAKGGNHVCILLQWREFLHHFYIRSEGDRRERLWFGLSTGGKPRGGVCVLVVLLRAHRVIHVRESEKKLRGVWGQQSRCEVIKAKQRNLYSYRTFHCRGDTMYKQTRRTIRCTLKHKHTKDNQMQRGKQMFSVCFLTMLML